jgi:hypothetical protein
MINIAWSLLYWNCRGTNFFVFAQIFKFHIVIANFERTHATPRWHNHDKYIMVTSVLKTSGDKLLCPRTDIQFPWIFSKFRTTRIYKFITVRPYAKAWTATSGTRPSHPHRSHRPARECPRWPHQVTSPKFVVDLGKRENLGTNVDLAVFKIVWWILWQIFWTWVFS